MKPGGFSRRAWLGLLALLLAAWLPGVIGAAEMEKIQPPPEIRDFLRDFSAAVKRGDLDEIMGFYARDFLLNGRGKGPTRAFWRGVLQRNPRPDFRVELTSLRVEGDIAHVSGRVVLNRHQGPLRVPMLKREAKSWRWYGNQVKVPGEDGLPGLKVSWADPAWDGQRIPPGQQCQKFGGRGATPGLVIHDAPAGANAIIMEFSDRDWPPMDHGGHGRIGFHISPNGGAVKVPPVPGHTYELPAGFFLVTEHQGASWDKAGAYMPPCSGGRGNRYYLTIKAVRLDSSGDKQGKVLAGKVMEMGVY